VFRGKNSGVVDLPLHSGKCPKWLFPLMKNLSKNISELIINEYGENELLKRISDPYWFQSLGCVIGFDWHSSGLTTTTTGALKEALKNNEYIGIAGGKGKASLKTPEEIKKLGEKINLKEKQINNLIKTSRISAKVDNCLIQDGFRLYHHTIFFTKNLWAVVQQGRESLRDNLSKSAASKGSRMSNNRYARRYHWIKKEEINFVNEPHSGIISDKLTNPLNLTAKESEETKKCSLDLIKDNPLRLRKYALPLKIDNRQRRLTDFTEHERVDSFKMPLQHFPSIDINLKTLVEAYEQQPKNYEELIMIKGMGEKNIRSLALISHLVYGTKLSWKDPVKYSFAHGGKDGWPYPVDENKIKENAEFLKNAIKESEIGDKEKTKCLRRLNNYYTKIL